MRERLEKRGTVEVENTTVMAMTPRPDLDYLTPGKKAEDRENPQGRLGAIWLAAMLECEGCFTFDRSRMKYGMRPRILPIVCFQNTDMKLVEAVIDTATRLGFAPPIVRPFPGKNKPLTELRWWGLKILPFLEVLQPCMVGVKAENAKLMIEYIQSRRAAAETAGRINPPITDYELSLVDRVFAINGGSTRRRPKLQQEPSQTECQGDNGSPKLQSGLHGDMQRAAEMTAPLDLAVQA